MDTTHKRFRKFDAAATAACSLHTNSSSFREGARVPIITTTLELGISSYSYEQLAVSKNFRTVIRSVSLNAVKEREQMPWRKF